MRIAQVAPLQVVVPPRAYGGPERVIANLTEALVRLGHDVTLFATGDSQTSAGLVSMREAALNFNPAVEATAIHIAELTEVYRRAGEFDVIHSHLDYLTLPFAAASATPTVVTLHGRLDAPEFTHVLRLYHDASYVAISDCQRDYIPDLNWVRTIHHGVDVAAFPFNPDPGDYLIFVGRISPEKDPVRAIRVAKLAGIPLVIAAKVDPKDRGYFEEKVRPLLNDPLIQFVGEANEERKRQLMSGALALLLPIDWPEPFGMVFIESLACGTPVLTRPCGSVPELLRDGVTGYIRVDDDELAEAALRVRDISRAGCRAYARERFDMRRMALDYARVYAHLVEQAAAADIPRLSLVTDALDSSAASV